MFFDNSEIFGEKISDFLTELSNGKMNKKIINWMMFLLNEMSNLH